jgi:PKD repeat protein
MTSQGSAPGAHVGALALRSDAGWRNHAGMKAFAVALAAIGITAASTEAASAHHFVNASDSRPCTTGFNTYKSGTPDPRAPGVAIRVGGDSSTDYRYRAPGQSKGSHVRVRTTSKGSIQVGDVGGDRFNEVDADITGTPATAGPIDPVSGQPNPPARTIDKICRWFDDPFRAGVYGTPQNPSVGSREHFNDLTSSMPGVAFTHKEWHPFVKPGFYEIFGHAVDDAGAWSDRATREIYINGPPTPSFKYSDFALNRPVTFTSTSKDWVVKAGEAYENGALDNENGPLTYAWDLDNDGAFDDGTDSTATRSFATAKPTVRLKVADRFGTERVADIIVGAVPPTAGFSFSPTAPVAGVAAEFSSAATDADGSIVKWEWEFDNDGRYNDASGPNASYAFPLPGSFPVSLRVTDNDGLQHILSKTVSVTGPAAAATAGSTSGAIRSSGTSARALRARLSLKAARTRRGARITRLQVRTVRGAAVRVSCKGKGCSTRSQRLTARSSVLRLKRFERSFAAGARIEVFVTKRGSVGRYLRVLIRKGAAPRLTSLCLASNGRSTRTC